MTETMVDWRARVSAAEVSAEPNGTTAGVVVGAGVAVGAGSTTGTVLGLVGPEVPRKVLDELVVDAPHAATARTTAISSADKAPTPRVKRRPEANTVWTSSGCRALPRISNEVILGSGPEEHLKAPPGAIANLGSAGKASRIGGFGLSQPSSALKQADSKT
jgi:hypothetical protein